MGGTSIGWPGAPVVPWCEYVPRPPSCFPPLCGCGGRRAGAFALAASILATVLGASSVLGITDLVPHYGAAAVWWLLLGALGLFLAAFITLKPLYRLQALTIIDALHRCVGKRAAFAAGPVLVCAWIGIIAAQFVALGRVMAAFEGGDAAPYILLASCVLTTYMCIGGQNALLKADRLQLIMLVLGLGGAAAVLFGLFGTGHFNGNKGSLSIDVFPTEVFSPKDLLFLAFPLLGAYLLGPDIFGRINAARDIRSARRALCLASVGVVVFAFVLITLAMFATLAVQQVPERFSPLLDVVMFSLPRLFAILFCLALVAAMSSSADTCLLTLSSVLCYDVCKKRGVFALRLCMCIASVLATIVALVFLEIIPLLLSAYTLYTASLAAPFLVALLARKWFLRVSENVFLLAMFAGGTCSAFAILYTVPFLPLVGIGLGVLISLVGLRRG